MYNHRKLKIEQYEPHWQRGMNSGATEMGYSLAMYVYSIYTELYILFSNSE
jgi:hypothetical protein